MKNESAIYSVRWSTIQPPVQVAMLITCSRIGKYKDLDKLRRIFNLGNPRILIADDGKVIRYEGIAPDDREVMRKLFTAYL